MAEVIREIILEPGQTLVDITGLDPGETYDIQIQNERDGVLSSTATIPLTTPQVVPPKPIDIVVNSVNYATTSVGRRQYPVRNFSIGLSWDYDTLNTGPVTSLRVEYEKLDPRTAGTGWFTSETLDISISDNAKSATIRPTDFDTSFFVSPGRTASTENQIPIYRMRMQARNTDNNSEWSDYFYVGALAFNTTPQNDFDAFQGLGVVVPRDITDTSANVGVSNRNNTATGRNAIPTEVKIELYSLPTANSFTGGTKESEVTYYIVAADEHDWSRNTWSTRAGVQRSYPFTSIDHNFTGLTENTHYGVRATPQRRAFPSPPITATPTEAFFTTLVTPVEAPEVLVAESITHTSMTLEWVKNTIGGTAVTYLAELSPSRSFPSGNRTQVTVNESSETTFQATFRGLDVATQYYMRVTAINTRNRARSDIIEATTLPQPTLIPAPPTNLRPTATTYNSMSFAFTASAVSTEHSAAEDYTWQVSTSQAFTPATTVEGTITDLTALVFSVYNLLPNRYYFVRVRANNEAGAGGYVTNTNTTTAIPVPAQVTRKPTASDITPNGAKVTWRLASGIVSGYTLTLTGEDQPITYSVQGAGTLEFELPGLSSETDYSVTVAAFNGTGTGQASPAESFTTLEDVAPIMSVADSTTTTIDFTWTTGTLFGDSWTFEYKLATATDWIVASQEIEGEAYTLEGLTEFTQYNARVKNNAGDIYSSATAVFTSASSITPPTLTHTGNRNRANTAALILTGGSLSSGTYYWRYRIRGAGGYPATWTTVSLSTNRYSFTTTEWAAGQQVQVEGRRGTRGPWSNRLEFISFNPYIRVSDITPTSVVLHAGGGNPADSTTDIQQLTPPSTWTTLTSQTRTLAYTVSDLTPDTEYSFRARRNNENSLTLTIRTTEAGSVAPGAPTALAMRNLDNLTGTLTWTKGTGVVTSYTAQISTQQSFADALRIVEFTIDDGDATTYRFPDNTFLTHTTNYLRLIANNAVGSSAPATFTIPTPQPASAVGPNLRTAGLATIIQMRFDGGDPSTDALIVEWTPALSATQPRHTIVYDNSVRLAATATTHNITGLNRASRYWVSIRREFGPATVVYVQTV